MMNTEITFFGVMAQMNERYDAKKNGQIPKKAYPEILADIFDIASQTEETKIVSEVKNWVPENANTYDLKEYSPSDRNYKIVQQRIAEFNQRILDTRNGVRKA